MVTEKFAKDQILRLSRLRNFPSGVDEAPLRADLVSELRQASSEDMARSVVDNWLAESEDAPSIAQLRGLIRQRLPAREVGCQQCDFTGFLLTTDANDCVQATPCQCHPLRRERFAHA